MKIEIELAGWDRAFGILLAVLLIVYSLCSKYGNIILGWFIPMQ